MPRMNASLIVSEDGKRMEVVRLFGGVRAETVARLELSGGAKRLQQEMQALAALAAEPGTRSASANGFPRWLEEEP